MSNRSTGVRALGRQRRSADLPVVGSGASQRMVAAALAAIGIGGTPPCDRGATGRSALVHITTITLKRLRRVLTATLLVATLAAASGCDRAATVISQVGGGSQAVGAVSFEARVVGITDGDTLTVLDDQNQQHKIRLAEIDAPERGQPWGDRAKQALSALVFSKTISVQQTDTDRYGRIVARVFAGGQDVNRTMVEQGAAWAYRRYLTDETLIATEARARRERVGLWSMSDAQTVAPWEWRRGERVATGTQPDGAPRPPVQSLLAPISPARSAQPSSSEFSCSGKRYCRQMSSCAEANFYLRQCGLSTLDGNSDGQPCEVLCGTAGR
jgi:endonuclease YncB( thermonuclease family)